MVGNSSSLDKRCRLSTKFIIFVLDNSASNSLIVKVSNKYYHVSFLICCFVAVSKHD